MKFSRSTTVLSFIHLFFICCAVTHGRYTRKHPVVADDPSGNKSQGNIRNEDLSNGINIAKTLQRGHHEEHDGNARDILNGNHNEDSVTKKGVGNVLNNLAKNNNEDLNAKLHPRANSKGMDVLAKRIVGEDSVFGGNRRRPTVPSYVWTLYNASNEDLSYGEKSLVKWKNQVPTIRTVKPYTIDQWKQHSDRLLLFKLNEQHRHIDHLEIVLYIVDIKEMLNANPHGLISILSSDNRWRNYQGQLHENFLIFDITNLRTELNSTLVMDRNVVIGDQSIKIRNRMEPIMVVFEYKVNNPILLAQQRAKRDVPEVVVTTTTAPETSINVSAVRHFSSLSLHSPPAQEMDLGDWYHCRRYDWTINMRYFGWNWYAFPEVIQARYCSGQCPFPLDVESLNSTNYSFLKNRWRLEVNGQVDESVPEACCTPVSYLPVNIIYLSSSHEFVMKEMPDMRVESCGCR